MNKLSVAHATMRGCDMDVGVYEWRTGDPFPDLGNSVGVDTETELITETVLFPPLVVLGVFSPATMACYIIYAEHAPAFMKELCRRDIQQRYFNLGFDEGVLSLACPERPLIQAIDSGRVRDMQIRIHLASLADVGYIEGDTWSLAACAKKYLGYTMDKGDGSETSDRMSFRRGTPITESQSVYLALDCITTWALGEAVKEQPVDPVSGMSVEVGHTKGMCVMAHIQANGFPVDPVVHDWYTAKLKENMEVYRQELVALNFPDPLYDPKEEQAAIERTFSEGMNRLFNTSRDWPVPSKSAMKHILTDLWNHSDAENEQAVLRKEVYTDYVKGDKGLRKAEEQLMAEMIEKFGIGIFIASAKKMVMPAFLGQILIRLGDIEKQAYHMDDAIEAAAEWMDEHPLILKEQEQVGPKEYFQQHVKSLLIGACDKAPPVIMQELEAHKLQVSRANQSWTDRDELNWLIDRSSLKLETTEKSGDLKLTLKDMWRLEDMNITDKFLDAYTNYKHCEKYLSTYMDTKYIKPDGKVHAKYTNLVRTGRTSCTNPNCQNLPSRDKTYQLKLMFQPPKGAVLCATDFSFIELCGFGQNCYTKYRNYERKDPSGRVVFTLKDVEGSVMRKVINAGLDPHRWFAGVMTKVIQPDLSKANDPEWVKEMKAFLKEHVPDKARQNAKMAKPKLAPQGVSPAEEESELLGSTDVV